MKTCFLFCFIILFYHVQAQQSSKVAVISATRVANTIEYEIRSEKPFYMGDNMYILHIADKNFTYSQQKRDANYGYLTFFIPEQEYNRLLAGSIVWLSYGYPIGKKPSEEAIKDFCIHDPGTAWLFEPFSDLTK